MNKPKDKEQWLPVVGYEGLYEVSNMGNVRSTDRIIKGKNWKCPNYLWLRRGVQLKPKVKNNGYLQVNLYSHDGVMRSHAIHRLVMEAFVGPSTLTVNHINENKADNRLSNLEYLTAGENVRYSSARAVESFDLETFETVKFYPAGADVLSDGHDVQAVNHCCRKDPKYLSHHGLGWRFANVQAT